MSATETGHPGRSKWLNAGSLTVAGIVTAILTSGQPTGCRSLILHKTCSISLTSPNRTLTQRQHKPLTLFALQPRFIFILTNILWFPLNNPHPVRKNRTKSPDQRKRLSTLIPIKPLAPNATWLFLSLQHNPRTNNQSRSLVAGY